MKTAHLISQYLLQNKKMKLQGFGEFSMEGFYENPFDNEKGKVKIPENTIHFKADKKTTEDEGLVEFISKSSGKIKPLAFSDLEDFLNIGKQLLNVSKQFYIEGLGTIILEGNGNLGFKQGHELIPAALPADLANNRQRDLTEEQPTDLSFQDTYSPARPNFNAKKLVVALGVLAGIAIIVWVGLYFYNQVKTDEQTSAAPGNIQPVIQAPPADSATSATVTDSLAKPKLPDTLAVNSYKVVIENAKKTRALARFADLQKMGYRVQMTTEDSVTFKLFTLINGPIADSAKVRDSISRFFGRKVWVEAQ